MALENEIKILAFRNGTNWVIRGIHEDESPSNSAQVDRFWSYFMITDKRFTFSFYLFINCIYVLESFDKSTAEYRGLFT